MGRFKRSKCTKYTPSGLGDKFGAESDSDSEEDTNQPGEPGTSLPSIDFNLSVWEAANKSYYTSGPTTKRRGVKAGQLRFRSSDDH